MTSIALTKYKALHVSENSGEGGSLGLLIGSIEAGVDEGSCPTIVSLIGMGVGGRFGEVYCRMCRVLEANRIQRLDVDGVRELGHVSYNVSVLLRREDVTVAMRLLHAHFVKDAVESNIECNSPNSPNSPNSHNNYGIETELPCVVVEM